MTQGKQEGGEFGRKSWGKQIFTGCSVEEEVKKKTSYAAGTGAPRESNA